MSVKAESAHIHQASVGDLICFRAKLLAKPARPKPKTIHVAAAGLAGLALALALSNRTPAKSATPNLDKFEPSMRQIMAENVYIGNLYRTCLGKAATPEQFEYVKHASAYEAQIYLLEATDEQPQCQARAIRDCEAEYPGLCRARRPLQAAND